jgi:hypothetical protein
MILFGGERRGGHRKQTGYGCGNERVTLVHAGSSWVGFALKAGLAGFHSPMRRVHWRRRSARVFPPGAHWTRCTLDSLQMGSNDGGMLAV